MSLCGESAHIDVLANLESRSTEASLQCIDNAADLSGGMESPGNAPDRVTWLHDHLVRR